MKGVWVIVADKNCIVVFFISLNSFKPVLLLAGAQGLQAACKSGL